MTDSKTATSPTARVIGAGVIGNMLEWYDFGIYGFFAPQIGHVFFPAEDRIAQILAAFGVFAIGYLMRPLGGIVMGYIGDHLGRRAALTFSVTAMAIPTFLVGILPGYQTLGLMAPVLLTMLRVVQGLSVGGEYATAMVFLVERAPPARRGLLGAICSSGSNVGILLGSATGTALAAAMSSDALADWGWRLPFIAGLFIGLAGLALRRGIEEVPITKDASPPLLSTLRQHLPLLVRLCGLSVFLAVGFYLMFLYIVSWLQTADGIAPEHALEINTISILMEIPTCLFAGWLSDHVGRRKIMLFATVGAIIGSLPLFWLLHHQSEMLLLIGQAGFVLFIGLYEGTLPAALVEAAPHQVRCTAVAVGYNIPLGIIGGLTPMAATWLVERTADQLSPAFMMIAAAVVSTFALLFAPETFRQRFQPAAQLAADAR
jgi:MHS family proline/betaine transporter-like MFS transporter